MSLVIDNLHFSYGSTEVLKGVSSYFENSTFYAIVGPNGCGKSTLLKCLYGYLSPGEGTIKINNHNIMKMSHRKRAMNISYVAQSNEISFDFAVKDIVAMGRNPYISRFASLSDTDISHIHDALEKTSMTELKDKSINELSGGEKQRAFIARALAQDTEIILLDEPVSMLDINHQIEIMDTVKSLSLNHHRTIIAVLHDLNLASLYADCVILMNKGSIHSIGSSSKVLTKENINSVYKTEVDIYDTVEGMPRFIVPKARI
ncbi:MAG: ABC transporter ATP-binding protein [Clostridia bacterium]|nr:ABC transporter ATP-binding protein [Clostridia bacterium]